MRWSIRWRLTMWNTAALAALLVGFGALVYGVLDRTLLDRLDRDLQVELRELIEEAQTSGQLGERIRASIADLREHENYFCVVYDSEGQVFARTRELAAESIPPPPAATGDERRLATVTLPVIGRQRTLHAAVRLRDRPFRVILLAPLEEFDAALRQLLIVFGTVGPVVLLAGGGVGYWLARKALAPMDQLHRAAGELTAERLDRRLAVANPDDELGRLTATLNAMIARLERSFAEIRRFTADASHELRTPLTALRTEVEVALQKPLAAEEVHGLLGSILEECDRLTRLTEQLLTLSREDAGAVQPPRTRQDLGAALATVVETMRPVAQANGLHLDYTANGALPVHANPERLRQVFYHLLDNAIKYTPAGGRIAVRLEPRGPLAVVTIHDSGIGVPPEHLPHVFERFYRVDQARSRAEGGAGLGLSIAQSIVTAHGGTIVIDSQPGQGTRCEVVIPCAS